MDTHRSKLAAKKLWRLIQLRILLLKRGLMSKRKHFLRLNMAIRRSSLMKKPAKAFLPSRYHRHRCRYPTELMGHSECEYESTFLSRLRKQYSLYIFSCIGSSAVVEDQPVKEDEDALAFWPRTMTHEDYHAPCGAPAAVLSSSTLAEVGGFDVSSEDQSIDGGDPGVDDEAEEFIRMFYEQLRNQSSSHLLQY